MKEDIKQIPLYLLILLLSILSITFIIKAVQVREDYDELNRVYKEKVRLYDLKKQREEKLEKYIDSLIIRRKDIVDIVEIIDSLNKHLEEKLNEKINTIDKLPIDGNIKLLTEFLRREDTIEFKDFNSNGFNHSSSDK